MIWAGMTAVGIDENLQSISFQLPLLSNSMLSPLEKTTLYSFDMKLFSTWASATWRLAKCFLMNCCAAAGSWLT